MIEQSRERIGTDTQIPDDYIDRVYAGWLGKVIGVRHGANVESWTYDKIQRTFGEVTGYLHQFKNFAADDDTNGPLIFLRALEDYTHTTDLTAEQIGLTWLNYAPDGHGFFWWGGYGVSTEHTAYLNLKHGMKAPKSGSIAQNGAAVAEQIGGQIFIDVWGLIAPGNPTLAADYAAKAASVSHDGNGVYGGMFIAACIARAFIEKDIKSIIEAGLSVIPSDCEYTRMVRDVIGFYDRHPQNWRDGFKYVYEHFGYDKYPGIVHIIPNSAVIILSLLYGEGDFSRTINICNMCGWDTDCNVGNVGTIMGVRNGLEGIDASWVTPINDFLCCSTVVGSMNILDLPSCATTIANIGYKIAGASVPERWEQVFEGQTARFHFEYPGSTHAFRTVVDSDAHVTSYIENTDKIAASGSRSLKVVFDKMQQGCGHRVYHKTYYRPEDFEDSRYDPGFSPTLYPGQTVSAKVYLPESQSNSILARLYVKNRHNDAQLFGSQQLLQTGAWQQLRFDIPENEGFLIEEAGIEFVPVSGLGELIAYVDDVDFSGVPNYSVNFNQERLEVWSKRHVEVSQWTYLRGYWTIEDGEMSGSYFGEPAEAYTGDSKWRDYQFSAFVRPKLGEHHRILFRVQGAIRSYAVGFAPNNQLALYKNTNGYRCLCSAEVNWVPEDLYQLTVTAVGNHFVVSVDGKELIDFVDDDAPYLMGQVGFGNMDKSHTHYQGYSVRGIQSRTAPTK